VPPTLRQDSYVSPCAVPPLLLLARQACRAPPSATPSMSVKEGLEYYHDIVWGQQDREAAVFRDIANRAGIVLTPSVRGYERLCKEPLKVALFLERKVRLSREKSGAGHKRTKGWLAKYHFFLRLPIHDLFLVAREGEGQFRVLEYATQADTVGVLCLSCPQENCKGCIPVVKKSKEKTKLKRLNKTKSKKQKCHKKKDVGSKTNIELKSDPSEGSQDSNSNIKVPPLRIKVPRPSALS